MNRLKEGEHNVYATGNTRISVPWLEEMKQEKLVT